MADERDLERAKTSNLLVANFLERKLDQGRCASKANVIKSSNKFSTLNFPFILIAMASSYQLLSAVY